MLSFVNIGFTVSYFNNIAFLKYESIFLVPVLYNHDLIFVNYVKLSVSLNLNLLAIG